LSDAELFSASTVEVARRLIGMLLVHDSDEGRVSGWIRETEAYLASDDPASHSRCGRTKRNASMFLAAGHVYVYRIYGMHHCFNVVTGPEGLGEAVLIRALVPQEGLGVMRRRRGRQDPRDLCSGPAKLVQALGIEPGQDGCRLGAGRLRLETTGFEPGSLRSTARIGIRRGVDLPLRFLPAAGG
jgi:DNA-3-methyladenine glycosylase